jgi:oxygen-independent coproporphyrinogen-3 oxidase
VNAGSAPEATPSFEPPADVPHVYVHFPFCARKCPYCDFNSHAGRDAETDAYVEALLAEANLHLSAATPRTLFVGGGTPTHPDAGRLERYLAGIRAACRSDRLEEFTVEANPGSLNRAKIRALRRVGVDRVSLGVQSFDDRHLRTLGRIHGASDAVRAVELLREGGIARISIDLILAIPGQTLSEQERDLARAIDLGPEHVSAYVLTVEEGTGFARLVSEGRMPPPEETRDLAHLHLACDALAAAGFRRYEISNHARPGAACVHNLGYWGDADWIGLGAGAHSHVGRRRWKNEDDPARYARRASTPGGAVAWAETATPAVALFEAVMMGLRLIDGVDLDDLARRTGADLRERHREALDERLREGLLALDGARLRLTARGLDLASWVLRGFLPD